MANNSGISIVSSQQRSYLDETGQPVQGFSVRVQIDEINEQHDVLVPNLNPETVKKAVMKFVDDRKALMTLFDDDDSE